ncbi:hypothetical protein IE337_04875 [Weissella viridescens]|uniref:hypothetical protein n=1 Tax=Weissella viridescens TaxID=1629 RepID=UPI001745E650|nr:hypothetical protein [Weissella viridescens]QOD85540.1 hypothetical protein IE337_04875 [Weissella viridescens]WJI90648.1 hypothetical protein PWA48_04865 [Weissella viridescens]
MTREIIDKDGNVYVVKQPWYKKAWIWVLIILLSIIFFILASISVGGYYIYKTANTTISSEATNSTSETSNTESALSSESKSSEGATSSGEFNNLMTAYDDFNQSIKDTTAKAPSMSDMEKQNASIDLLQEQNEVMALQNEIMDDLTMTQATKVSNKSIDVMQSYEKLNEQLN